MSSPPIPFWRRLELERLDMQVHSSFIYSSVGGGVGAPGEKVLSANPKRLAIVWGNATGVAVFVKPGQLTANNDGIVIPASANPFTWTFEDLGPLVCSEWWMVSQAVVGPFNLIEVFSL